MAGQLGGMAYNWFLPVLATGGRASKQEPF